MPPDATFDGIGIAFQFTDFFPQFLKPLTLIGHMAFKRLLKCQGTFDHFFGVLLEAFKGGRHKH
jgi:hypothetical protein